MTDNTFSDPRFIRADVLQAALTGIALGGVIAALSGKVAPGHSDGMADALEVLNNNIDRMVEESILLNHEEEDAEQS